MGPMSTAFPVTWLDFSGVFTCTERHGHWCSTSNSPWPAEQRAPRPRARRRVGQHEFAQMGLPLTRPKDRLDALEATLQLLPRLWG